MTWQTSGPPIRDDEDERELKCAFALFAVKHPELEGEAGYDVFPGVENYGRAMQANWAWPHDPIVRAEKRRLGSEGVVASLLPAKEQVAKEILDLARDEARKVGGGKDAVAAYKLYGEYVGHIAKGPAVSIDNRTINVLRVPMRDVTPEDDTDFERRFEAHQTALVANARNNRPATVA